MSKTRYMHPAEQNKPDQQQAAQRQDIGPDEYFGNGPLDEKEALKYHSADTPEGLRRALNEQFGGQSEPIHVKPKRL